MTQRVLFYNDFVDLFSFRKMTHLFWVYIEEWRNFNEIWITVISLLFPQIIIAIYKLWIFLPCLWEHIMIFYVNRQHKLKSIKLNNQQYIIKPWIKVIMRAENNELDTAIENHKHIIKYHQKIHQNKSLKKKTLVWLLVKWNISRATTTGSKSQINLQWRALQQLEKPKDIRYIPLTIVHKHIK